MSQPLSPLIRRHLCLGPHGFHHMAYAVWGEAGASAGRPVLCVHGLTRNGRDFDPLARRLAATRPVLAPDVVGRGQSDWLAEKADYGYALYAGDIASLIASLGVSEIDYIGTSMGGIIGMILASQQGTPIRRLVLNDVGPFIPQAALERIAAYVGRDPAFATLAELQSYLSLVHANFGLLSEDQWRHMAEHGHRRLPDGRYGLAYDPGIAEAFKAGPLTDVDLWALYDRIACPTLVVHGVKSDLLTAATTAEMTRRGPHAEIYDVAEAGHAPALMTDAQIDRIAGFLDSQ